MSEQPCKGIGCSAAFFWQEHALTVRTLLPTDDHALVYWPEEDCVSVVPLTSVVSPLSPVVHQFCHVRIGKKSHKGVTMEIGT